MTTSPSRGYRFGEFELDVSAYELRFKGRVVRVERRPMELLLLLVERPRQLVTRTEIAERVWGNDVFVDVETGVNTLVWKLRQTLRDSSESPRFIETVAGKGYRFVAPIEEIDRGLLPATGAATDQNTPALPPSMPAPLAPRRLSAPAAILTGVVLVLLVGSFWIWRGSPTPSGLVTIAVLPFENLTGDAEREYLADAFTEETGVSLGQIDPDHLQAIGRTSTMTYKETRKSLSEIGRELRADYLVESSIQFEGTTLRITAKLVRAADEVQLWSAVFDAPLTNLLGLQRQLSTAIAEQIRVRLSPERSAAMSSRESRDVEAVDLYRRGRYFVNQRTPDATERAIDFLKRATARDTNYALAWAALAEVYAASPINGDAVPAVAAARAREATTRAVQANPGLAEAHTALATINFWFAWDWATAEAAARHAIALDRNYPRAHLMLAVVLSHTRRFMEASREIERAIELDPSNAINHAVASEVAFRRKDFEAALNHATVAIKLGPDFWIGYMNRGQAYQQKSDADAAVAALNQAAIFSDNNSKTLSLRGYIMATTNRPREAQETLTTLEAMSAHHRYVPPYATALIHAGLGDRNAAFDWLDRAYAVRDVHLVFLTIDPKWDQFRNDPRFEALMKRCGFPRDAWN